MWILGKHKNVHDTGPIIKKRIILWFNDLSTVKTTLI